ncbi:MAG: hypothetical protein SOX85_04705 [Lachnospiraceae bacterium]|nr:hypothetical protein [Lachnospiraceae bacterium]
MTEKELKRLSRADLLEMLITQSKKIRRLEDKLEQAEDKLHSRQIAIDEAGSIAEASLALNGVFDAAQAAGQQYLENIQRLSLYQEAVCAQMEQSCQEEVLQRLTETEKRCTAMETETKVKCAEMIAKAKAESRAYWDEVENRLENFCQEYTELRELLSVIIQK